MLPDNPKPIENKMTLPPKTSCLLNSINTSSATKCSLTTAGITTTAVPVSEASSLVMAPLGFDSSHLALENIMPGIYLTKNFLAWSDEKLHSHGFTHVITIDKHIQELYYPSIESSINDPAQNHRFQNDDHSQQLRFAKEFEILDLNFGEKSYLITVLPNCYKAVKFIDRALSGGGTILVIDCNGGEQKCLTILAAYLMYKKNYGCIDALCRLKFFYKKADLEIFYISQLYEYEPILQVQRAQSRGHSCSRELHSAILKRKKLHEDHNEIYHYTSPPQFGNNDDVAME